MIRYSITRWNKSHRMKKTNNFRNAYAGNKLHWNVCQCQFYCVYLVRWLHKTKSIHPDHFKHHKRYFIPPTIFYTNNWIFWLLPQIHAKKDATHPYLCHFSPIKITKFVYYKNTDIFRMHCCTVSDCSLLLKHRNLWKYCVCSWYCRWHRETTNHFVAFNISLSLSSLCDALNWFFISFSLYFHWSRPCCCCCCCSVRPPTPTELNIIRNDAEIRGKIPRISIHIYSAMQYDFTLFTIQSRCLTNGSFSFVFFSLYCYSNWCIILNIEFKCVLYMSGLSVVASVHFRWMCISLSHGGCSHCHSIAA